MVELPEGKIFCFHFPALYSLVNLVKTKATINIQERILSGRQPCASEVTHHGSLQKGSDNLGKLGGLQC